MTLYKPFFLLAFAFLLCIDVANANTPNLRDREQLESFSDGVMATSMQSQHVAGAVLSVVADGEIIFSKGYGYRDVQKQLPVDPTQTLFRIASITKLLTWTALMQLHEQNKLELDTDINEYLDGIDIPATFDEPITIRHLMSHTPGLEDHVVRLFSRNEEDMRPFLDLLNEELPIRVRAPGELPSYSNHGTALAAVIVEQVSGQIWTDYIETNILKPLAMSFTSVRQPLPASLAQSLSQGYRWKAGKYMVEPFEFVPLTPAGGASSSANDISRLMLAFLNGGELDGARILESATVELMLQRLYPSDPRLSSTLHGFYESNRNGQRIVGHGGDTIWFHSELMLLPDSGVGVFISTNTDTGPMVRRDYINAFLDRFFPPSGRPKSKNFLATDTSKIVGNYASLRTSSTDFTKLGNLISGVQIEATPEGQLMLLGSGDPQYYNEIDSGLFQREGDNNIIAFRFNKHGQASHFFLNQFPTAGFERINTLYTPGVQFGLLGLCGLVFLWVLIAWPIQHISPRWDVPKSLSMFRITGWILALTFILLSLGFAVVLQDSVEVVFGVTPFLKSLLFANFAIPLITLILILQLPSLMRTNNIGLTSKVFHIAVVLSGLCFSWFLYTWRMYGY